MADVNKERPILFSAPMVRALLAGTKTQTRRVVKNCKCKITGAELAACEIAGEVNLGDYTNSPYGQPGDRLWVRETWRGVVNIAPPGFYEYAVARYVPDLEHCRRVEYAATQVADSEPWRSSIHMPRWASRITLEITNVRVERLHDISDADAVAEGCTKNHNGYYLGGPHTVGGRKQMATEKSAYRDLWESINGAGSWDVNPWVWVVEFKRVNGGAA